MLTHLSFGARLGFAVAVWSFILGLSAVDALAVYVLASSLSALASATGLIPSGWLASRPAPEPSSTAGPAD